MATIGLKTFDENRLKKSVSLSTATIRPAEIGAMYGNATPGEIQIGDVLTLFNIPPKSVLTNAGIVVKTKATATTAQIKLDVGTTAVMDATAVGSLSNVVIGSLKGKAYLPTGGDLKATISVAKLTDGDFEVFVEYYEVGKATGELTN